MSRSLYFVLGIALVLGGMEAMLRFLPVSTATLTGYYQDPLILSYPAGHRWQVSTGWDLRNPQAMRANNLGFAAEHDFVPNPKAVALIGDSFVEASMLDAAERPAAQLERALGGERPVYAMAAPGSSLLDYAERMRWAAERLQVRDFVLLLEAGDIRQSICGSGNIHGPCLQPGTLAPATDRRPPPSWPKRLLRHSALAQYLFGQVKFDATRFVSTTFSRVAPGMPPPGGPARDGAAAASGDLAFVDVVARTFLERAGPFMKGRLVLAVDGGRSLDRDPAVAAERDRFVALMRQAGLQIVDARPLFQSYSRHSAWRLEVGPYDAHMNSLAVRLLMDEVARRFSAPQPAGRDAR